MAHPRTLTLALILGMAMTRIVPGEDKTSAPPDLNPWYMSPSEHAQVLLAGHGVDAGVPTAEQAPSPASEVVNCSLLVDRASHPASFYYGGYDQVLVKPYFSRNIAYWNNSPGGLTLFSSFDWDTAYTPRFWLGYQAANGMGVRGRYWSFDDDVTFSRPERPGENLFLETTLADASISIDVDDTLVGRHALETSVVDLEFTKRGDFTWGWLMGGGGLRYTDLDQNASWLETETPHGPRPDGAEWINLRHGFQGTGPTLSLEGGTPLFGSNLSFFVNGRASLLFGNRSASIEGASGAEFIPSFDGLLSVLEAQTGLEWAEYVGGHRVVFRTAVEAQSWQQGGGASGGDDEGLPADHIDMGFFGASVSTTVEF